MPTETLTLTYFLLARIAEDMTTTAGYPYPEESWHPWYEDSLNRLESNHDGLMIAPSRILAECDAKRRIVSEHPEGEQETLAVDYPDIEPHSPGFVSLPICERCSNYDPEGLHSEDVRWPCPTMRALASVYADHPDYQDEWRAHP